MVQKGFQSRSLKVYFGMTCWLRGYRHLLPRLMNQMWSHKRRESNLLSVNCSLTSIHSDVHAYLNIRSAHKHGVRKCEKHHSRHFISSQWNSTNNVRLYFAQLKNNPKSAIRFVLLFFDLTFIGNVRKPGTVTHAWHPRMQEAERRTVQSLSSA